jgi:hypothetical protein
MVIKLYSLTLFFLLCSSIQAQKVDYSLWTDFLQKYVSSKGQVDYKAISLHPENLDKYLSKLVQTIPNENWSKNETLAFWINAYNAFTIKLIVENYPIKSIKDIESPWDKKFIKIGTETLSLNHIEHNILRKMDEPRIHFAIVCASISCPKLLNEAYTSENLENQLNKATKEFLSDSTKNNISEYKLELSKIFQWFSKDFKEDGSLIDFLNLYSEIQISNNAKITFTDYNWNLND